MPQEVKEYLDNVSSSVTYFKVSGSISPKLHLMSGQSDFWPSSFTEAEAASYSYDKDGPYIIQQLFSFIKDAPCLKNLDLRGCLARNKAVAGDHLQTALRGSSELPREFDGLNISENGFKINYKENHDFQQLESLRFPDNSLAELVVQYLKEMPREDKLTLKKLNLGANFSDPASRANLAKVLEDMPNIEEIDFSKSLGVDAQYIEPFLEKDIKVTLSADDFFKYHNEIEEQEKVSKQQSAGSSPKALKGEPLQEARGKVSMHFS